MGKRKKSRLKAVLVIIVALFALDVCRYFVYPDVSVLKKENPKTTAMMELREREWEREGKDIKIRRVWTPLSRISPYLVKAVLIGEDDKFWSHEGFDVEGMEKALEKDIEKRRLRSGGSTISQQLAKNLYLSPSRNPVRKVKEAILTWRMERALSKRRILEIYLNVAEWGEGVFGAEAAARRWYGKSAASLGPEEAARLAAVLPNPRKHSPVNPDRYTTNRSRVIYRVMVRRGVVLPDYDEVMSQPEEATAPAATPDAASSPDTGADKTPDWFTASPMGAVVK